MVAVPRTQGGDVACPPGWPLPIIRTVHLPARPVGRRIRPPLVSFLCALCAVCAASALVMGCGERTVAHSDIQLSGLSIQAWERAVLLAGTPMLVHGTGFLPPDLGTQVMQLSVNGALVTRALEYVDEQTLRWSVGDDLLSIVPPGSGGVSAGFTVTRTLTENGLTDSVAVPVDFRVESNLTPTILAMESDGGVLYPGDEVTLRGNSFLLAGEGTSVIVLEGEFVTLVPPETTSVQAVLPLNGSARDVITFALTPDILGIRPGSFTGRLSVSNEAASGVVEGVGVSDIEIDMLPPKIDTVTPSVAARGQRIKVSGRGFLPTDPFYGATTLIVLEGSFAIANSDQVITLEGPTAMALFPDAFDGNTSMEYILRVTRTPAGELAGLGLQSGHFEGRIRAMLLSGPDTILGNGLEFDLQVAPQRQVVFIKYIPGFSTTVAEMGLAAVESQIRARIATVLERDYSGINIEFRDSRPEDFIEYSIIEVGGADPNQAGLFGLDNTAGKDVGNVRFNDVIGGTNAETAEQGYYAFGGVFVRSFFQLSPSKLGGSTPLPIASPRFDDLFAPFMEELGGSPVTAGEIGGGRQPLIDVAVRALGNLVGNTVTHEIGHSLGLTNIDGEFHNIGDNPGWIMDSGNFRPFQERAEIDGQGPAFFSPNNRSYLERILPLQ
ncbi:MAG: hypothetical protein ACI9WU_002787 [Myxococcota bacterium]|jgi:hypothetical protein